jgi:hypothetical protein
MVGKLSRVVHLDRFAIHLTFTRLKLRQHLSGNFTLRRQADDQQMNDCFR